MTGQLNLLGIPAEWAPLVAPRRLSPAQRDILRLAARKEGVTTSEAGRVVHAHRRGGQGCRAHRGLPPAPCCLWMSSDGWDALKRLTKAGLVDQPERRGPYFARTIT